MVCGSVNHLDGCHLPGGPKKLRRLSGVHRYVPAVGLLEAAAWKLPELNAQVRLVTIKGSIEHTTPLLHADLPSGRIDQQANGREGVEVGLTGERGFGHMNNRQ